MTMVLECPICRSGLSHHNNGTFDSWVCERGHGLGFTLSEAYGTLQEDEIRQLWATARQAVPGDRLSPLTGKPMVVVAVSVDDDEADGAPADAPRITIDVDEPNQFLWLDAGELEQFPRDLANPGPTAEQLEKEAQIMRELDERLDAIDAARAADPDFTERLYQRLLRHPMLAKAAGTMSKPLRLKVPED